MRIKKKIIVIFIGIDSITIFLIDENASIRLKIFITIYKRHKDERSIDHESTQRLIVSLPFFLCKLDQCCYIYFVIFF